MSKTAKEEEKKLTPEFKEKLKNAVNAANAGNVQAMYALGSEYWNGKNVRYDPDEAVKWWKMAAEKGHVTSMYNLGVIYEGKATSQFYDQNLAGYWFHEAAVRGNPDAQQALSKYRYNKYKNKWSRK